MKKAVVLLSGGLDSATVAAVAREHGFELYALSFEYGQRHSVEIDAARRVADSIGVMKHHVARIDLAAFGGSSLTGSQSVPKNRSDAIISEGIPNTYVPARNTIFLSFALGWAEVLNITDLFIGVTAVDYSGYPDCRPAFISAFEAMANLATKAGVEGHRLRIHTPLIDLKKSEIITLGTKLGVPLELTHSCYDPSPDGKACGACDSCLIRIKGFSEAGISDPTQYV